MKKKAKSVHILVCMFLVVVLLLTGCAYHKVTVARVCGDEIAALVEGTPVEVKGKGVNAVIVRQVFFSMESGREAPPLCDITSKEKGEYSTKSNSFFLKNVDVVTKQGE